MTVLVVGASGLLGSNVVTAGKARGRDVVGTYHSTRPRFEIPLEQLDVRNTDRFRELIQEYQPTTVINCAAMTDVDGCESNPDEAFAINAEAPEVFAAICAETDTRFVHISTDYIFDGSTSGSYAEAANPNPQQVYGESKLAGEQAVRTAGSDPLVIRPSFVYGVHRSRDELTGFPAWVREQLTNGESVPLFTDQYITPSRAGETAETLLELGSAGQSGVVHIAARSCVTPYEFGEQICRLIGASVESLEEGSMDDVDRPAKRPKRTCLDVSRVEEVLDRPQPTLTADLATIDRYFS
ncbi:dTDP-4-dehydrorhamnose reductase [Halobacteriaceae bacterium SHR40]|uniref:dTDP-4-dehydrorhamnose reductase n=1 Tax=Halovenus amylolytica TaxID=2500550 RepID=UPI000FE2F87C